MTATVQFTGSDLTFIPVTHEYLLPDGRKVPNVTSILRAVGVSTDFEALSSMSSKMAALLAEKRDVGTAVHMDCHSFDDGALIWDTVDDRVKPYLEAWCAFRENSGLRPVSRERRVFHPLHHYCGTLDGIFVDGMGKGILVDIKTGDPHDAAAHLQLAAYEAAYLAEFPDEKIDERWSVRLCPESTIPYQVINYSARPDAWRDWQRFACCLAVYAEQPARRGK